MLLKSTFLAFKKKRFKLSQLEGLFPWNLPLFWGQLMVSLWWWRWGWPWYRWWGGWWWRWWWRWWRWRWWWGSINGRGEEGGDSVESGRGQLILRVPCGPRITLALRPHNLLSPPNSKSTLWITLITLSAFTLICYQALSKLPPCSVYTIWATLSIFFNSTPGVVFDSLPFNKASCQKLLSGFFPLRG